MDQHEHRRPLLPACPYIQPPRGIVHVQGLPQGSARGVGVQCRSLAVHTKSHSAISRKVDWPSLGMAPDDLRGESLSAALAQRVAEILGRFTSWLETFGEASFDHQSFYAGPFGRRAKGLYHTHRLLGTAAVAPLVFFEAFVPSMRRFF